jgi:predicted peptidase
MTRSIAVLALVATLAPVATRVSVAAHVPSPARLARSNGAAQQSAQRFEREVGLDYLLYVPPAHDPAGEPVPLLLFLHGAGERGSDLAAVARHGPPKLIAAGADFPAIIVSPQAPAGDWWTYRVSDLLALLDEVIERYNVDEDRVYVTGLSMGGYGAWALLVAAPQRFAAAVPICGGGNAAIARYSRGLREVPVWAFHGDADEGVPLQESVDMVETIQDAGGTRIELTIYPGVDHDSWTQTYDNPAVWEWLWSQRRGSNGDAEAR